MVLLTTKKEKEEEENQEEEEELEAEAVNNKNKNEAAAGSLGGLGLGLLGLAIEEVYAHVWEANEEGVEWYVKRGFVVDRAVVENYYRRLRPQGARLVRRRVGVGDWVRMGMGIK